MTSTTALLGLLVLSAPQNAKEDDLVDVSDASVRS